MFDLKSLIKYLLEGLAVAVAVYLIPKHAVEANAIALIALTAAAMFAILDTFAPLIAIGARQGAGFGLGIQQVGFGYEGFDDQYEDGMDTEGYDNYEDGMEAEGYDDYENEEGFEGTTPETMGSGAGA